MVGGWHECVQNARKVKSSQVEKKNTWSNSRPLLVSRPRLSVHLHSSWYYVLFAVCSLYFLLLFVLHNKYYLPASTLLNSFMRAKLERAFHFIYNLLRQSLTFSNNTIGWRGVGYFCKNHGDNSNFSQVLAARLKQRKPVTQKFKDNNDAWSADLRQSRRRWWSVCDKRQPS